MKLIHKTMLVRPCRVLFYGRLRTDGVKDIHCLQVTQIARQFFPRMMVIINRFKAQDLFIPD